MIDEIQNVDQFELVINSFSFRIMPFTFSEFNAFMQMNGERSTEEGLNRVIEYLIANAMVDFPSKVSAQEEKIYVCDLGFFHIKSMSAKPIRVKLILLQLKEILLNRVTI